MSPNPASPEVVEVAERSSIKGSRIEIDRFRSYRSPWAWSMLATSRRALLRVGVFRLFRAFRRVVFGHEAFCAEVRGSRGCAERAFSDGSRRVEIVWGGGNETICRLGRLRTYWTRGRP